MVLGNVDAPTVETEEIVSKLFKDHKQVLSDKVISPA